MSVRPPSRANARQRSPTDQARLSQGGKRRRITSYGEYCYEDQLRMALELSRSEAVTHDPDQQNHDLVDADESEAHRLRVRAQRATELGTRAIPDAAVAVQFAGDMTYETLCQLEDVKVGAGPEFLDTVPLFSFRCSSRKESADDTGHRCAVCLSEYEEHDLCSTLYCMHIFHFDCLLPWLRESKLCPVCKKDVFEAREEAQLAEAAAVSGCL